MIRALRRSPGLSINIRGSFVRQFRCLASAPMPHFMMTRTPTGAGNFRGKLYNARAMSGRRWRLKWDWRIDGIDWN